MLKTGMIETIGLKSEIA